MAVATFVQEGDAIDYTPSTAVAAGDVIVNNELVGVAKSDIDANTLGALAVMGVFDFPKASGASTAIGFGVDVYWDSAAVQATTNANAGANKKIGRTVASANDNDTTVRCRLSQ